MLKTQRIKLDKLAPNIGQIPGLPMNPRNWTDEDVERIAKSLRETPELFEARPIIATPFDGKNVILGGNLRYEGAKANGDETAPVVLIPAETPVEKMREIVIKDNGTFGQWDVEALLREWDNGKLSDWGVPNNIISGGSETNTTKMTEILSGLQYSPMYYEPKNRPFINLSDCVDLSKFNEKVSAIEKMNLPQKTKQTLKLFCYRFIKIDFERVADYYFFNATKNEKAAIERLRLVLIDTGVNGFIDDDLLRIAGIAINLNDSDEND